MVLAILINMLGRGIRIADLLNKETLKEKIRKNLDEKNNLLKKVYDIDALKC